LLWTCDRFCIAFELLGTDPEVFKAWYLQKRKINQKELRKNINDLLRSRSVRRVGKYHNEFARFAEERRPELADLVKQILTEEVDISQLAQRTGLSFRRLASIHGISSEFQRIADAVGRGNVNRVKLERIHSGRPGFIEKYVCGSFDLYRYHSQKPGLVVDGISFFLDNNAEVGCKAQLYNVSGESDYYEGRALFDGRKAIILLTKAVSRPDYVDSVLMLVLFSETYQRYAAILSASVDQNEDTICAARAVLVRSSEMRQTSKIVETGLSKLERRLLTHLDNGKPIHKSGDRVLMFNNLTANAEN
jgi:hypothetical protein